MPESFSEVIGHLASGAAGGLITLFLNHFLSKNRDKTNRAETAKSAVKTRRREFCAFLRGWRADFSFLHMKPSGFQRSGAAFVGSIPVFIQMADMMRHDLSGYAQKRFVELVSVISERRGDAVGNKEPYEALLKDFEELLSVSEAP